MDLNSVWLGVPLEALMENAGKAVAKHCQGYDSIAVFCGRGNNGGDGLVAARHLIRAGKAVKVFVLEGERTRLNQLNLTRIPPKIRVMVKGQEDFSLDGFDLIVDALIGVGVKGSVKEPMVGIIGKINRSDAHKVSVDTPSAGMVEADEVISFHTPKVPGAVVEDIGIPSEAQLYCGPGDVIAAIPPRTEESRKGDFGRLIVFGGCREYVGTPTLVAQAALRSGADLVTVCVPQYVADHMVPDPNLIVHPLASKNYVSVKDVKDVLRMRCDAMVFGNGLGRRSVKAVQYLLKKSDKPLVVDADALSTADRRLLKDNMILTPHEGEFAKLFGRLDDRIKDPARQAKKSGAVIVLKGAVDVVSDGRETRLNRSGNPYMTVGGTGDVLAGIIGGFLAQNGDRMGSAAAGAFISGLAGDIAARQLGVSLLATDVIAAVPQAIRECFDLAKKL